MEEIPELDGLMGVYQYSRINQCIQEALEGKRPVYTGGTPAYLDCFASKRKLATPQYMAYLKKSPRAVIIIAAIAPYRAYAANIPRGALTAL